MAVVGRATSKFGSGAVTRVLAFGTYLVIPGAGLAWNLPTLFLALVGWGLVTGGLDVAMNAQAVQIETSYRRPIMSSFHAWWSVGTVLGTVVGSLGAGLNFSLASQQAGLAVVLAIVTLWIMRQYLPDHTHEEYEAGKHAREQASPPTFSLHQLAFIFQSLHSPSSLLQPSTHQIQPW